MKGFTNVQKDMQWVRRCKQEELTLIEQFINEEDNYEKQKLYQLFLKKKELDRKIQEQNEARSIRSKKTEQQFEENKATDIQKEFD